MSAFEFRGVRFGYDVEPVLHQFSLAAPAGSTTAVIGPSGSGKTTLLRLLAGFEQPQDGSVLVGDDVVAGNGTFVAPHLREVGIVPQEGALFPHLRVRENVAFGLRGRRREVGPRVEELLALTGLDELGDRYPRELSGGQQQRVALARALAPRPRLVLLDEPFASLDPATRHDVRAGVRAVLAGEAASTVLVTHDHEEALALGDQVAVMASGRLLQVGPPDEVYEQPRDEQVARLLGAANVLRAELTGDRTARCALGEVRVGSSAPAGVRVMVRPTSVEVSPDGVEAVVLDAEFVGSESLVTLELADRTSVTARLRGPRPTRGETLRIGVRDAVHLLP